MPEIQALNSSGLISFDGFTKKQKDFIFADSYMVVNFGGVGSGKTTSTAAACLFLSLSIPRNRGWIARSTSDKLEQSIMKEFFLMMGTTAKDAREHPLVKHWNQTKRELVFRNGSEVKFISLEAEDCAKGPTLGWYAVDQVEECTELSIIELDARCRLPSIPKKAWRGYLIGNPSPGWCKRTFKDNNGSFREFKFFSSTTEDLVSINGPEYLDRLLKNRPKWWIDRMVYGGWGTKEGQVFHKFSQATNCIEREEFKRRFDSDWPVIAAYDHGSNSAHPCAMLWLTWDPADSGVFYIFEGIKLNLNVDEFADQIKAVESKFMRNPLIRRVADIDTFGSRGIGTPAHAYLQEGIGFTKCNKKPNYLTEAIASINTLFGQGKLIVVSDMTGVLDEFEGWEYREAFGGSLDSKPKDVNDDYCKCALYLLLELHIEFKEDMRAESHKTHEYDTVDYNTLLAEAGISEITGW